MKDSTNERTFKYTRGDFGDLPIRLDHLTLYLNFADGVVTGTNCLEMTATESIEEITLDADDLEICEVQWCAGPQGREGESLHYDYKAKQKRLIIKLPRKVDSGEKFFVKTITNCVPSDHILEGLYKDVTPSGAPQQYMSQCQQWGFQRIMPIFDDCRAKCTMTTTIEASCEYTHLISNGNISSDKNPNGRPVPKQNDPSRQVITYENPIPMSPYLFLVCVGTWDCLKDVVTYPSGRTVNLEYLLPPGQVEQARLPMRILKEGVLWIGRTQGYEYTFDTYRTICMTKSNFGGMENLGNTTIVTDAALITEDTVDRLILYAHAVIVHEFEHNQCGSETTMETPFDVWLNEAYTVDVERQFMADKFDPAFVRLLQVDSIRAPVLGPLAIEDAGHYGRIVREGFNEPDELIDGVTYVKAAEVIRMLALLLGAEKFKAGKTLYFERYHMGNADTDDFFACFEEVAGIDLQGFKKEWLYRVGYPKVKASTHYDKETGSYKINFSQDIEPGKNPFHIPIKLALVDRNGVDIEGTEDVFILKEADNELVFEGLQAGPLFTSFNRDYSFYGTFEDTDADTDTLTAQARLDSNAYNRVEAMRKLTDRTRVALLLTPEGKVDEEWLTLYGQMLIDTDTPASLKSYLLRIDEQPLNRNYATWYPELVLARETILKSVNARYRNELIKEFRRFDKDVIAGGGAGAAGIEERMLRNVLLGIITIDDSPESHTMILDYFKNAQTATERVAALALLNRSSAPVRREKLEEIYRQWHTRLSGYANYLRVVAGGTNDDVFEMIAAEEERDTFDITQPTWNRALYLAMAGNNKMLWTKRGIRWLTQSVIKLAPINSSSAGRLLSTFQVVKTLKPELRAQVTDALGRIEREVTAEVSVSVNGQAKTYLGG